MNKLHKDWLKTGSGYEDWRAFWEALGNWANQYDFTYRDSILNSQNKMLLYFLADDYYDSQHSIEDFKEWDMVDKEKFAREAVHLGLKLPTHIARYA